MEYHVEELNASNASDWQQFNQKSSHGTFFHTLTWKEVLEESFPYTPCYFVVYRDSEPVALCPFYKRRIKGIWGLVCLPHSDYNHVVLTHRQDTRIALEVLRKSEQIATQEHLWFIYFALPQETRPQLAGVDPLEYRIGGNMVLNLLENSPERIWTSLFGYRQRRAIRRIEKAGFRLREVTSRRDLQTFYSYYRANLAYIHGNPHRVAYFEQLASKYLSRSPPEMRITLLSNDGQIAGGLLQFLYHAKKTMYLRHLSLNRKLRGYNTFWPVCWDAVCTASELGYAKVCFGDTPPDPSGIHYMMKQSFGCVYETKYSLLFAVSRLAGTAYRVGRNFARAFR